MNSPSRSRRGWACFLVFLFQLTAMGAGTFRVATYNLESYLEQSTATRPAKPPEGRAKVRESIRALRPDVIALQEIGTTAALQELQQSLSVEGLDLPYWEYVVGFDTNIHIAILSRFPFVARRSHTNENFLLGGRRFRVSRGFGEVDIQVNTNYTFTLITAHLKSKRTMAEADESELRLEEAKLLRAKVNARLELDPNANIVVLGDFNDTKDAPSTKAIIGRGKHKLVDTRPSESDAVTVPTASGETEARSVTWTHYYGKEDTYSRIDFLLLSAGMAREWVTNQTCVLACKGWGQASDHRPLVATFEARNQ